MILQALINEEIPPIETHVNPGEQTEDGNQCILNDQIGTFEEVGQNNSKDIVKNIQIEDVVNNLLVALHEGPGTKAEIMEYINHDDDVIDLEIDDWLMIDSWGNTPAVGELILLEFENL